ncbi:tripartite tricarboxylate transport protein TctABC, extracytoplasmic tricarboxylate-binding receptor TctC [Campylobacter blaseri]|uniref:Tripartite tricarboxylate transporter substrate binding protein n=1 Tax=Campylobacter blaseri TaxID=2042961 RepID=A0A2P8R237_9BACT|nr:tripartite tricarboxylate transporter substrate binding protein [Campylobacter blaseri]PSM52560.1 hypothetical protein CQ405_02195 [Campylobacter blaseri]PSM54208.1 hypothetical protein CRN67_02195 [Campylobacter blaseri]QKF85859.1 tripartite tricarboxylate transport protein TctABC, extracytoplasmic tricarboxylate-binding receptor TctC [Campylobacter blaseri]
MRNLLKFFLFVSIVFSSSLIAKYPSKTIEIIVPSKAGGSTDLTARLFAETAKKYWKDADFTIVNRGGAGGLIGFEAINRSKPDGYTLGLIFTPQLVAHIVSKRAKYNLDNFKIVGNVAEDPGVIVVNVESPINNLEDLVKKAKTEKLTVAVNGVGSDDYIAAKNLEKSNGISFNLMPTKGSTEQTTAILGNHIDASVMNLSQMITHYKAGKVKIIAILSKQRSELVPNVLTSVEQGYDVLMTATRGFIVPGKVKDDIYKKIVDLYTKVINDEEFKKRAKNSYIFLKALEASEYKAYLEELQNITKKVYDESPW